MVVSCIFPSFSSVLAKRTGSPKVVNECQVSFGFLPVKSQILIRTASFLQKFTASVNYVCCLRMMRAGSYIIFSYNLVIILKPHASYAMLYLLNSLISHSC